MEQCLKIATNVKIINKISFLDVYLDVNTGWYVVKSYIKPFGL